MPSLLTSLAAPLLKLLAWAVERFFLVHYGRTLERKKANEKVLDESMAAGRRKNDIGNLDDDDLSCIVYDDPKCK